MGYLHESIAMASRSKRCQKQWGEHYQHCQNTIIQAIDQCNDFNTAIILGAGSLRDIPLETLSQRFQQVLLVDLSFLKSARDQVKAFSNVALIDADITENISHFYQGDTRVIEPQRWLDDLGVSLVVSLNLITQLPLLPAKWLMKRYQVKEDLIDKMSKQLIQHHLNYLQAFSGVKCLIADRWDTEFDAEGNIIDEFDPWWDITQPETVKEWDWELVPIGEGKTKSVQKNRVGVSFL